MEPNKPSASYDVNGRPIEFVSEPVVQYVAVPVVQPLGKARHAAGAGAATTIALAALALATQSIKPSEGYRSHTYLDVARIPTECYGHADRGAIVGTNHTQAQCDALFNGDVGKTEKAVERCTPGLNVQQLAAATSLAFNTGTGAYCRSSIAKNFNAGNPVAACIHFEDWRFAAGKPVLLPRRKREEKLCLEGS